jgi:tetratricopeptide (TPR) repeat protein
VPSRCRDECQIRNPVIGIGVEDVDPGKQAPPGRSQQRSQELDEAIGDALVFDGRGRSHVQHAVPHLVPPVEAFRAAIRELPFSDVYEHGSHLHIVRGRGGESAWAALDLILLPLRRGHPLMRSWSSIHGRCRVHRAEILRLRGCYPDAEEEAHRACEELRPYLRREFGWPLTELGRIRLRRGDVAGAEQAFLAAQQAGWDPQPGLALVHLARGQVDIAATMIRDALEHPLDVPSKELPPNSELRRAPLLEAHVEIAIAAGDLDSARTACDALSRIAAAFDSRAFAAGAAAAHGRVQLAEGDPAGARRELERAVRQWIDIGAPVEAALVRLDLAAAYRAEGNGARALVELQGARDAFERLGVAHQAARAAQALEALRPPPPTAPPPRGAAVGPDETGAASNAFLSSSSARRPAPD